MVTKKEKTRFKSFVTSKLIEAGRSPRQAERTFERVYSTEIGRFLRGLPLGLPKSNKKKKK